MDIASESLQSIDLGIRKQRYEETAEGGDGCGLREFRMLGSFLRLFLEGDIATLRLID